jgi:hypothetical protein
MGQIAGHMRRGKVRELNGVAASRSLPLKKIYSTGHAETKSGKITFS